MTAATSGSCHEGYICSLDQDLAGLGGDNRFIRHEVRAEYYYSIIPDVVLSVSAAAAISTALRRRRTSHRTVSSSAATTCAVSSSAASVRAIRRPTTSLAAISTMSARPRCASRWLARGAAHLRPHLRRCRLAAGHRRERPDPRREQRSPRRQRRRSFLVVAARPALDELRFAGKKEDKDNTESSCCSFGTEF